MMLLLLILLQAERRLSPFVIIGAVLVFIAGVSLLVYFYRRYKRMEKETEDDWDAGRHSLFVKVPSTNAEVESKAESLSPAKVEEKREPTSGRKRHQRADGRHRLVFVLTSDGC
jgi:heme/copper-type cytochrome/quinol oxidase subunit 1